MTYKLKFGCFVYPDLQYEAKDKLHRNYQETFNTSPAAHTVQSTELT